MVWPLFITLYAITSSFIGGEVRNAKRSQFIAMPGSIVYVTILMLLLVLGLNHAVGTTFLGQLGYPLPQDVPSVLGIGNLPTYNEVIATMVRNQGWLVLLLGVSFLFWTYVWLPINFLAATRAILAWAFDGLFPRKLSEVNERYHTPIYAIAFVWVLSEICLYLYVDQIFNTLNGIFAWILSFVLCSIAATVFPYRRRDLWQASPWNGSTLGIPNITLLGGLVDGVPRVLRVLVLVRPGPGLRPLGHDPAMGHGPDHPDGGRRLRHRLVHQQAARSPGGQGVRRDPAGMREGNSMSSVASQQTRQGWHSVLVGGIATFMGAPQVEADADALRAAGVKAAFLGMPFDSTTIARPGAQLGPRAVRDWSSHMLSYHGEYDLDIFEALGVADMGDVAVVPANAPKTVDLVADAMGEAIKAGAIPVLCGGEHITTIGGSMAVDRHAPDGTYGLILVDTHLDTAPDVGGERINHCCPITRAMELARVRPGQVRHHRPARGDEPEERVRLRARGRGHRVPRLRRRPARRPGDRRGGGRGSRPTAPTASTSASTSTASTARSAPGTCVPTMGGLTAREALTMVSVDRPCGHRGDGRLRGRPGVRQRRVGDGRLPGDRRHAGRLRGRAPLTQDRGQARTCVPGTCPVVTAARGRSAPGLPALMLTRSCGQAETARTMSRSARRVTESPGFVGAGSQPISQSSSTGMFMKTLMGCGISMPS